MRGALVMSMTLLMSNPSIPSKLSCRAGVAQDAQIALVAQLRRITLEGEQQEQQEHPSMLEPLSELSEGDFGLVLRLLRVLMS